MLTLLAVTIGTGDAISIGVAALIAGALVAAVKINEKQGSRLTVVEAHGPKIQALEQHDKAATKERHELDKRTALIEQAVNRLLDQDAERSGIHRKPPG